MRRLIQPSAENPALEWIAFALFLVLLFGCLIAVVTWIKTKRPKSKSKRKRKHRHHHHQHNTADLPPARPVPHELPPKREPNPPPAT